MILPFKIIHEGRKTHFMEKMMVLFGQENYPPNPDIAKSLIHPDFDLKVFVKAKPKLHTLREDKNDRWKAGMKIHAVIHNRSSKMFRFLPVFECTGVQRVRIAYTSIGDTRRSASIIIDGKYQGAAVWHNCKLEKCSKKIRTIAQNDGFDTVNDFFEWFSEDWEGKIIHWTDLRY